MCSLSAHVLFRIPIHLPADFSSLKIPSHDYDITEARLEPGNSFSSRWDIMVQAGPLINTELVQLEQTLHQSTEPFWVDFMLRVDRHSSGQ